MGNAKSFGTVDLNFKYNVMYDVDYDISSVLEILGDDWLRLWTVNELQRHNDSVPFEKQSHLRTRKWVEQNRPELLL
jgi:hypothetical protein